MFSLFALVLFSLSLFMTPPVADITVEEPLTNPNSFTVYNPQTTADYPVDYTRVDWDLGTVNEEHNNTWSSNHYRFGPTINWHTRNTTDSSLITWTDEIAIDEYVDFKVEIPFSALGGQTPSGMYLMGQYFNMSALANSEGEFHMGNNQPNMWMVYYNITGDNWLLYSSINTTWPEDPPTELPSDFTLDMVFGTEVDSYVEMDPAFTGYAPTAESYWANVRLRFNSSTIGGFYTVGCGVQDQQFNEIASSRFEDFNSGRIIGTTFDFLVNQAVGGYYDWERVSDDGSPLYSASYGVDFNMTAAINNGTQLTSVSVLFEVPHQIRTELWVYGPYTVTEEVTGVWEYDNVTETYWWNAGKAVNWTSQKEGYHFEEGYQYLDTGREYNFWEAWGPDDDGMMYTWWTSGMAAIVYNFSTGTFSTQLAYHYENSTWVDDEWGGHSEMVRWFEYEEWPMDGSITLPFVVNETTSESYWVNSSLVVNFRGHIGDDIPPTTGEDNRPLQVYEMITDIYGRNLVPKAMLPLSSPEDAAMYNMLRELAVESPVSIVTLTHEGEPYQPDWMFQTDIGESFTVKSWLQGGADYLEEMDGIGFFMNAHEEEWGFDGTYDWNQWSEIEVKIRIDPYGDIDVAVYNRTVRTQWHFGEHWDWVMVEVMPGRWEPQWIMIEDWFWEEMTWDFVADDWVSGWLSIESPSCRMPVNWLAVENITQDFDGKDLRISFDIFPNADLPQLEWNWKYFYGELTWVTDYESGWGEHTILGWNENTVYSYLNGTKMYMDEPIKAEIFRNNQTGDIYQREKVPFVEIDGKQENLEPYLVTDMETTWEENVRSEFNHDTGENEYFIQFENGTEIQVHSGNVAVVYNITLPAQGNLSFLAWNDYLMYTGIADLHSMLAVNGSFVVLDGMTWYNYVSTVHEIVETTMVEHTYVTIANGTIPIYMVGWPENIGPDHYVMYLNGTYEPIEFWWDPILGEHYWDMGILYQFAWPWELMTGVYNSQPFFIPHCMTNSFVYMVVDDVEYQLPAPGIPMWSAWELNDLENIYDHVNERYFANEYAIVNGTSYEAVLLPTIGWEPVPGYEYDIWQIDTGVVYNLTDWSMDPTFKLNYDYGDYMKNLPWTTIANGSIFVGDVKHEDWTVAYGHRDLDTYEFIVDGWLDLQTGVYTGYYDDGESRIHEWDDGRGYNWVETMVGEEFSYNKTWKATFLNVTLANGTFFYSKQDYPISLPTDPNNFEIDQYFMIDIYGAPQTWTGWMDYTTELIVINNTLGDQWTGSFFFEGMYRPVIQVPVTYWDWDWDASMWYDTTYMEDNIIPHDYFFLQPLLNVTQYEIIDIQWTPESYKFNFPSWAFNVTGTEYHAYGAKEVIYQAFSTWGHSIKLDYAPLPITVIRAQGAIVYGAPAHGMWDHEVWTVDPLSGALDLDGDLDTTFDQFYVREIHSGTDIFNITQQYLDVSILWEPDNATWDNEFYLHSYAGMVTFNWTYDWSELNIWTHTNGSSLTPVEYAAVYDLLFDAQGYPKPGYWGISWMFENRTYSDMIQQAQDEGWDWVEDNSQEWSWLWWELEESYSTEVSNGTHSDLMDVNLAYQYAGMFAWNDTSLDDFMNITSNNEITHFWMPIDVESVNFTTPGEGWGNFNTTDSEYRAVNETIDFGVTFVNVTGEVYPFGDRSYFDWYEGQIVGSDFKEFNERPSECLTEDFSIDVHFTGEVNATGGPNVAEVKFDIGVGQWDIDFPSATNPLEGMSLAVAFYSDLNIMTSGGMTANASYIDDDGQVVTNDQEEASLNFTMASGLSDVAMMGLGGAPYDWAFNSSFAATVTAQTVPLSTFSEMYISGGGNSATTFSITSQQFYTVLSFKWWDGYAVYVDPVFVSYISHGTADTSAPTISSISHDPIGPTAADTVTVSAIIQDISGLNYATLQYKIGSAEWSNVTMTASGDTWSGNIPSQADETSVTYRIVAVDNAGNEAISAESSYTVGAIVTTTTTTTTTTTSTSTIPGPLDDMMLILGGVGALILIVVIVVAMKKRK